MRDAGRSHGEELGWGQPCPTTPHRKIKAFLRAGGGVGKMMAGQNEQEPPGIEGSVVRDFSHPEPPLTHFAISLFHQRHHRGNAGRRKK